jgi:preprotein translocase subunit SecD
VLFTFGTGPVRGFAVVLSLGIVTSMFTALVGSRTLIHLLWGRQRKLEALSI